MKIFNILVGIFLVIFLGSKFFYNMNPKENGLSRKEQNAIKKFALSKDNIFELLKYSNLEKGKHESYLENGDIVVKGSGIITENEKEKKITFSIVYSKKKGVYTRTIKSNDGILNSFICSLELIKLIDSVDYEFEKTDEDILLRNMKTFDYGYLIKVDYGYNHLKAYFDDGKTDLDIINENAVFFEINNKDKKVRSFNINGIIGEYSNLEEAFSDIRNSPIPLSIVQERKYSRKSRITTADDKNIVVTFTTKNYYVRVIKQSSLFFKALIWNNKNKTDKPDYVYSNGRIDNDSNYIFEQNNKIVRINGNRGVEIQDKYYPENSIKESAD